MPSTTPSGSTAPVLAHAPAIVSAGLGAREGLRAVGGGEVLASFRRAAYLRVPGGIVVLVAPGVFPGPLYLRLRGALPRLTVGAPATAAPDGVRAGRWWFPVRARTWRGAIPAPARVRASAGRIADAVAPVAAASLLDPRARSAAGSALAASDLEAAAGVLEGRGPGLTPAGDDVLAGALFAERLRWGRGAERRLLAVADGLATGPIARAFVRWAARGQALDPAHRLVLAAVRGDATAARRAAGALGGVGESSGADFCLGLSMGLELLPARP